jgi:hypothetical protein
MDRRSVAIVVVWLWAGSLLIAYAILGAAENLHSTRPLMEGPIYWILPLGLFGAVFFAIGLRAYSRAARATTR